MTRTAYGSGARLVALCLTGMLAIACTGQDASPAARSTSRSPTPPDPGTPRTPGTPTSSAATGGPQTLRVPKPFRHRLPGMPASVDGDVYAAAGRDQFSDTVRRDPAYLYVPNSFGAPQTTVIDQRTHKIVRVLRTGALSQHVTPSWDLRHLYVEASESNQLVEISPHSGRIAGRFAVPRPYNLYFTPDGRAAIIMSEETQRIIFVDPRTFRTRASVSDPSCQGPNHADFSANGRYFVVTCEFSGSLLKVSTLGHRVIGRRSLGPGSKPQDVRLSPDGRTFYVADMGRDRLVRIPWQRFRPAGFTAMPSMPHGIYPSRDGKVLYVSDRGAGQVSVVSLRSNRIIDTWRVPGGGTPDMGGVSADGRTLWLSGRYDGYVYGWNTRTGRLIARIRVGGNPHGLLVWPQPGRYSLGHTGNMR